MNRLKELRLKKGMRQADLAILLNTKPQNISRYEIGDRGIDMDTLCLLCDIFECTADYFLCRSDIPTSSLSSEEEDLLIAWRSADDHARRMVDLALEPFKKEDAGQKAI